MFSSRSSTFDRLLEKATSQLLLEPDWDSILSLCDCIRQEDVIPKYALTAIKRKISSDNPHVSMFALQTIESVVKNCGGPIHQELATKENMEYFKDLANRKSENVKAKVLELIQVWSHAFRNESNYKIVQDTYNLMKMEGYKFPTLKESDAMFSAERAPEWKDGESCNRCRTQFGTFNRKHHCRHCGNVFCAKCSSKNSIIPKFGIEREVRVCDSCYEQLNKASDGGKEEDLPAEYLASPLAKQSQAPPSKTEREIQEEEELQLALALSVSEAESKQQKKVKSNSYNLYGQNSKASSDTPASRTPDPVINAPTFDTSEMDPELARYLNRNYWQQKSESAAATGAPADSKASTSASGGKDGGKANNAQPSAPATGTSGGQAATFEKAEQQSPGDENREQFLRALESSIQIFTNRMKSNYTRGRSIANDSAVQTLFLTINQMHPQLLQYIGEQEDVRARYENLQDKLAQLKDAREALDALREEHKEKKRREREELERQRAIQMAHKLEILRQKKQEYLEYQRHLALQRMEEQKRDMEMRLAQQKHMQMQRAMQYGMPSLPSQPQMYPQSLGPQPVGPVDGSPMHHPQPQQMAAYGAPGQPQQMAPLNQQQQPMMGVPPGAPGGQQPMAGGPPMSMPPGGVGMGGPPTNQPPQNMYNPQQPPQQAPGMAQQQPYQPPGGFHPGQPHVPYQAPNSYNMPGHPPPGSSHGQQPMGLPPAAVTQGQPVVHGNQPQQLHNTLQQVPVKQKAKNSSLEMKVKQNGKNTPVEIKGVPGGASLQAISQPQISGAPGTPPMAARGMMNPPPPQQANQPPPGGMPHSMPPQNMVANQQPQFHQQQQPGYMPQQPPPSAAPGQPGMGMGQPPMQQQHMAPPNQQFNTVSPPPPPHHQQMQPHPHQQGMPPPQGQPPSGQPPNQDAQLISFD